MTPEALSRSRALLGDAAMEHLAAARVAVFGVGGVGGWCAEALVRTGVGSVMIVDGDVVAESNLNRQVTALRGTIGRPKVEVLAERLRDVNPAAAIDARFAFYRPERADSFALERFDAVIDAIDSVADKAHLVRHCLEEAKVRLFSSMGAALRFDPLAVRATPFAKVEGDGLARALRQRFKKMGYAPSPDWTCVWSREAPAKIPERGSLLQTTGTFGFTLASLAISAIVR